MSGKGSKPRPFSVSKEKFSENWDAIFNKSKKKNSNKEKSKDINTNK